MNEEIKLSAIIPVYNGLKYIEKAVSSLLRIQHRIQIIIVNDGSTDSSLSFCADKWKNDRRILLLNKQNGGIASARNYGLNHASGKYVIFVDQDDTVNAEVIDHAIERMEQDHSDALFWSTVCETNGIQVACDTVFTDCVLQKKEITQHLLFDMLINQENSYISYIGRIWAVLFRRAFVNQHGICFKKFIDIEDDYLFVFDTLVNAQTVTLFTPVAYHWTQHAESETYRLKYIDHQAQRYTHFYRYLFSQLKNLPDPVRKKYILYIRQDKTIKILENNCSFISRKNELRETYQLARHNLPAFSHVPVLQYTKRKKRVFLLLNKKLVCLTMFYLYLDSLYRILKNCVRNALAYLQLIKRNHVP